MVIGGWADRASMLVLTAFISLKEHELWGLATLRSWVDIEVVIGKR